MFNKKQVDFLADFLADSISDMYEEISDYEKIIEIDELSDEEEILAYITETLNELKYNYTNAKELLEVTRNWRRIFI